MLRSDSKEESQREKPSSENPPGPSSQAEGPTGGGGSGAAALGQIAASPPSPLQPVVLAQAERISQDCALSESQITRIAMMRRQQLSSSFAGARAGLSGFFTQSIASAQAFIAKKQADITAAATSAITSVRTAISGALQSARAQVAQVRARINQTVERIKSSTQTTVDGIAKRITGTIDSIPFPNIPGVGRIRSAATGLVNRAAGVVTGALGRLTGFVGWVLNAGLGILDSLLRIVSSLVDRALALVLAALQRVIQIVGQALSRIVEVIGSTLRRILLAICLPILSRIERLIQMAIDRGRQHAIATLRRNRDQFLATLAAALLPGPEGAACPGSPIPAILQLGRDAIQNNRLIVQTFESITGRIFATIIGAIVSAVARTLAFIARSVSQAFQAIANALRPAIEWLTQTVQAVGKFVGELLQGFTGKLGNVAEYLRSLVQGGADRLLQFGRDGLSRIGSFITGYVRRLITGGGGGTDVMGVFTVAHSLGGGGGSLLAFLGPTPAFAGPPIFIIGGTLFIIIGTLAIVLPVWLAVVIAVVVLLLLILIIILIWRWLTKPKKPKPCPCTIVTKTLVPAPDGTPNTRLIVGVNERVEITASTSSSWSASHGSVSPAVGPSTIWTAPGRKASSCTIKAKPLAAATPCKVKMSAIEPSRNRQTVKSTQTYTPGLAGSGFIGNVVLLPLSVAFSRLETREDTATGKATGYYDKVLKWNGIKHPPGTFAPVDNKNGEGTDTVGSVPPGTPGPFSKGRFHWPIPQLYRILGGSSEIKYSTGDHLQDMAGLSGEETTSKEGASNPRTP